MFSIRGGKVLNTRSIK